MKVVLEWSARPFSRGCDIGSFCIDALYWPFQASSALPASSFTCAIRVFVCRSPVRKYSTSGGTPRLVSKCNTHIFEVTRKLSSIPIQVMKFNNILFLFQTSVTPTAGIQPSEQAINAARYPAKIVHITLYTVPGYGDPSDSQTLELSEHSCHNLGNRWRDRVRSASTSDMCTFYKKIDCYGKIVTIDQTGVPDLNGAISIKCPF
ncbi:hypothetical protein B0T16DRAFT_15464 [Cercophora newfieldiana]|uniref:Uncharacterized protein n=1 Tax=Cercophora newfieldiana TaxID=92897 RepID=A0AA39YN82_9PEZI|nr:hypothetical protein B0T16DRAFT_15464 [Cercophora newfieldiana]